MLIKYSPEGIGNFNFISNKNDRRKNYHLQKKLSYQSGI